MGLFDAIGGYASARQAQEFSRENYKHRYRWTMEDMRKAGLNPILAGQVGGGSGPPAAQANLGSTSALGAKQAWEQIKLLKQQTRKTSAEASVTEANVPVANLKAKITGELGQDIGAAWDAVSSFVRKAPGRHKQNKKDRPIRFQETPQAPRWAQPKMYRPR